MMQEIEFFHSGDVKITSSKIIFGRKTYAVRNISSAETAEEIIWWPTLICAIIGMLLGLLANQAGAIIGFVVGLAVGAFGTHFTGGFLTYKLMLSENAGRTNAFETRDSKLANKLEDSVTQAISHR
jgi:hypothetical protein